MTIFDNVLIQFTIACLLQFPTIQSIVISIYDRYYNLRRLLLQFTTGITTYDDYYYNLRQVLQLTTTIITIYDRYYNLRRLLLQFTTGITTYDDYYYNLRQVLQLTTEQTSHLGSLTASTTATVTKTSLKKWIRAASNFMALTPSPKIWQMFVGKFLWS